MPPFLRWVGGTKECTGVYEGWKKCEHHQCVLPACSKCDAPGPLWPRRSRHPDLTREVHLPPLSFLSSLLVNITRSIIIPLSASRGEAPRPTSPTTSYSAKGFPRPHIDQPQHHSCKWKAGLQTAAVFVSLSSLKKTSWNADWMLPYFSTASCYYSYGHSDSVRSRIWTCGTWFLPCRANGNSARDTGGQRKKQSKKSGLHVFGVLRTPAFSSYRK